MPNRLAQETSPYLKQHADNPVDWYPWGEEAFAAQIKGLTDLAADRLRPGLELAADAPLEHDVFSPFGVNVFLDPRLFVGEDLDPVDEDVNHAGGVLGGISSGQDILVSIALKPTSSLRLPGRSVNLEGDRAEAEDVHR